jgi:hypothetical protein
MKKTTTLMVSMLLFGTIGCATTLTLGPKANEDGVIGASASTDGASVTVPFIKAETRPTKTSTTTSEEKKK